jgi:Anti-sigma-K factor rskA/Putative zinc-finger
VNERRGFPEAHPHDDLAVYAIDALEGDELAAVEAHLATCAECQAELAVYQATLSLTVEDEQPPPWLWDQIAADATVRPVPPPVPAPVTGEPAPPAGAAPPAPPLHLQSRRPRRIVAALAAAAAVVVALLLAPAIADRVSDDDDSELVADDLPIGTITAEDGTPIARVEADDQGSLVRFEQATPLTPEQAYQLWSLDGPQPVSLGVLGPGTDGEIRVSLPQSTTQVAISEEPASGSPQPTGAIVGTGTLAPA